MEKSNTLTREYEILNTYGIHARPAAQFVTVASRYKCEISVEKSGLKVDGKSIMGLLTLEAYQGTIIVVTAIGADASEALDALAKIVANKFSEE